MCTVRDWLAVVPWVVTLREEITHGDAGTLAHYFWLAMANGARPDDALDSALVAWVEKHYRDRLSLADLGDPALHGECLTALDELTALLQLGSVYDFQR